MGWEDAHEVLLALLGSGKVPVYRISKLLRSMQTGDVLSVDLHRLLERLGLPDDEVREACGLRQWAAELLAGLRRDGVRTVILGEDAYPSLLREISNPPPVLFIRGALVAADSKAVAIVGSRRPSLAGIEMARTLAGELAGAGFTIVSGLARGIDTAAHRGALDGGGRTLAVLGSGMDNIYPPDNAGLADAVAAQGAVLTEFLPGCLPLRQNFPRRNRVISGLALGTVVIEAGERSGALITAACALDENRTVFAVPGAPGYARSKGANKLIKEGAKLVESARDVLEDLAPEIGHSSAQADMRFLPDLSEAEERTVALLSDAPLHVDEISRHLGARSSSVLCVLLSLETKGLARSLPGKYYVRQKGL